MVDKNLKKIILENDIDIIIPVPLNKKRLLSRGFNQVSFILDILNIEYSKIVRVKNTKHMSLLLDKNMRKHNISKAFYIPIDINKKNILIIDDIITTGSTIKEIIKELKISGTPKSITIFTFSMAHSYKKSF
ncbi:ComF family protein [Fusobacterium sp.]|uniref:ComF family protein n=1 Tax=Fusobacterium sp. TaxID=68766 RepID=UPI00262CF6FB|nr:phosphoribosyltransferase family protein [Fusobacterium sp.]